MKRTNNSDTSTEDSRRDTRNHSARHAMTENIIAILPELCDEYIELIHRFIALLCDSRGRPR